MQDDEVPKIAVKALQRIAARARLALVAARRHVVEIGAASALQQVAADRRHVADLGAGAAQNRAGQQRIAAADPRITGQRGVGDGSPDHQTALGGLVDIAGKPRHVNQGLRTLHGFAHQIDQIGTAAEILGLPATHGLFDRLFAVGDLVIVEGSHRTISSPSSLPREAAIASAIPL